jgi:hypothetical protein
MNPSEVDYFVAGSFEPAGAQPSVDEKLEIFAKSYKSSKTRFQTFLVLDVFLWPLWIAAYVESNRMRHMKTQVSLLGVDADWWVRTR